MDATRRNLLAGSAFSAAGLALTSRSFAATPTPSEQVGPFYPVLRPGENIADLTRVAGRAERALGQTVEVAGRILKPDGKPVGSAMILIWHANAAGRYGHPRNYYDVAADPGFADHALIRSAGDGTFRLITVKPGSYPDGMGTDGWRTPHIHYEVIGEESRLTTEMYFPDEPRNDADMHLKEMRRNNLDPRSRIATRLCAPVEAGAEAFGWDIVLGAG